MHGASHVLPLPVWTHLWCPGCLSYLGKSWHDQLWACRSNSTTKWIPCSAMKDSHTRHVLWVMLILSLHTYQEHPPGDNAMHMLSCFLDKIEYWLPRHRVQSQYLSLQVHRHQWSDSFCLNHNKRCRPKSVNWRQWHTMIPQHILTRRCSSGICTSPHMVATHENWHRRVGGSLKM